MSSTSLESPSRAESMSFLSSVCLSFHQPAEINWSPTGQQHMALLRHFRVPQLHWLVGHLLCGLWKLKLACSNNLNPAEPLIQFKRCEPNARATSDRWELPEAKDHLAQTSLLLGLNSPKKISPRIFLGLSWLSQLYEKQLMCFPYLLQAPKKTVLCVLLSVQPFWK